MKFSKKRLIAFLLGLALCLCFVACGSAEDSETESTDITETEETETESSAVTETETETETESETETAESEENKESESQDEGGSGMEPTQIRSLDGKKIIFIGNSYTYYGQTVLEKSQKYLTQESRTGDKGYFYQLCKANGMKVQVTNWTFGGHSLAHLFGGDCSADRGCNNEDHKAYLTDRNYDYVVIQAGSGETSSNNFAKEVKTVMEFFRAANPEVQFVCLVPYSAYGTIGSTPTLQKALLNSLKTLASEEGLIVVDWGGLVMDLINGETVVPNSANIYEKNTFVIRKSAKDGYHPNQLSGYITTVMTYCALTGDSAMNQPYDFCNNSSLRESGMSYFFSFSKFIEKFYTYQNATTNYPQIFLSKTDMNGIRTLIDNHLAEKAYMDYQY